MLAAARVWLGAWPFALTGWGFDAEFVLAREGAWLTR